MDPLDQLMRDYIGSFLESNRAAADFADQLTRCGAGLMPLVDHCTIRTLDVNARSHFFGSEEVRSRFPAMVDYVVQPKSRKDLWPYAAIFTPLGGFGTSFGIETVDSPIEPYPLFVITCASGIFASAPDKAADDAPETALAYLVDTLEKGETQAGEKFPAFQYVCKGS